MNLHIGGQVRSPGWTVLNIMPGPHVDLVGDCTDLSMIPDGSCDRVYASHVIEHLGFHEELLKSLKEIKRVLKPDAPFFVAVPDLELIARFIIEASIEEDILKRGYEQHAVMGFIFGGQRDEYDFHKVGFTEASLALWLHRAGFTNIQRVGFFGIFQDSSYCIYNDLPVSLNMIAT